MLIKLAGKGVRVKATGFGRLDFDPATALKDIHSANPEALMFGSDLPSTRAPRPYDHSDFSLVVDTLGPEAASRVFYGNAAAFYLSRKPFIESALDSIRTDPARRHGYRYR
jgi:predicted TIM-barrel fold metal-dependent hydrolase